MHLVTLLLMSGRAVKGLQMFAALSILIALHEFGHYFFARLFKTRVEKFYLFFDFLFPFSGILNFSLFKKKVGDTMYGIGWFPLGGYVKIAGMIDESMDKEAMKLPPQPWEYRSKKPYQRLFIMLGGILVNVLLAVFLYVIIFCVYGEQYLLSKNAHYGVAVDSIGRLMGLRDGDMLESIDGKPIGRLDYVTRDIIFSLNNQGLITLKRDGRDTTIKIPSGTIGKLIKQRKGGFILPALPAVVDSILPTSIAEKSGLHHGDSLIAINGIKAIYQNEVEEIKESNYGKPMNIVFTRNNALDSVMVTVPKDSLIGIYYGKPEKYLNYEKLHYGPIDGIGRGFAYTYEQFVDYVTQFSLFKSKEVKVNENVGGIISFGKFFPAEFNMQQFLKLVALISIILAFMNLLPIPGLDGGYVIFLLYEMITGRAVSEKVMEAATTVGLVLLVIAMLYFNGLDVMRFFHWH